MKYFNKHPIIDYNGNSARNILARAAINVPSINELTNYYPYTMKDGERADVIADKYYGHPDFAWLVWLSNTVVDPFYQTGISEADFAQLVISRFGSVERAQRQIAYWRTDKTGDEQQLSPSDFFALPAPVKKYFRPNIDQFGRPVEYVRTEEQWLVATNKIVLITVSDPSGFEVGEEVFETGNDYAFVVDRSDSSITVNHVIGELELGDLLTGRQSGHQQVITSIDTVTQDISDVEAVYYSPVSAYQDLLEKFEAFKEIRLVENSLSARAASELKNVLQVR